MDPKEWGPVTWRTMHAFAWEADRRNTQETHLAFTNFMQNLTDLLPCEACRMHMQSYLKENPLPLSNFFAYTVTFHNSVNTRLGKKNYTLEEATKIWTSVSCGSCSPETKTNDSFPYYFLLAAVIIFCIFYFKWSSAMQ
jgi:hypothetical protein